MGWYICIRITLFDKDDNVICQEEMDIYKGYKTIEFFNMPKNCVRYSVKFYNDDDSDSESEFDIKHTNDPDN